MLARADSSCSISRDSSFARWTRGSNTKDSTAVPAARAARRSAATMPAPSRALVSSSVVVAALSICAFEISGVACNRLGSWGENLNLRSESVNEGHESTWSGYPVHLDGCRTAVPLGAVALPTLSSPGGPGHQQLPCSVWSRSLAAGVLLMPCTKQSFGPGRKRSLECWLYGV